MALFTDLTETSDITTGDQVLLHQGTTDKRIDANALSALYFAKRNGYLYYGDHEANVIYNTIESFYTYGGLTYFPKISTTLPYTSTNANPANDSKLTTVPYGVYKDSVDAVRFVGSTLMTFDATDPNDKYTWQTWILITGDASIRLGDGTAQVTTTTGDNEPEVPVPEHTHTMDHAHTGTTTENGDHFHIGGIGEGSAANFPYGTTELPDNYYSFDDGDSNNDTMANTSTTGAHEHTLEIDSFSGDTGTTGTDNVTLDVRGEYVTVNLWLRTA